jgi:capsular polysaccharide biosynthesis protein
MNSQPAGPATASTTPASAPILPPSFPFVIVFTVWLLVTVTATLVTFILPESFSSTARIKIERDQPDIPSLAGQPLPYGYDPYFIQTEFEVIQSEVVLGEVIKKLDLNTEWGKKYAGGERLKTPETLTLLKNHMSLRPVRNTSLIEIAVYSDKPEEAATLANELAASYRDYRVNERQRKLSESILALEKAYAENTEKLHAVRAEIVKLSGEQSGQNAVRLEEAKMKTDDLLRFHQVLSTKLAAEKTDLTLPATAMVQIVDQAVPGLRPVRPNKPLNIFLGIFIGALSGLFLATLLYLLQVRAFRRMSGAPRTQFDPRFRAVVHILIALFVGLIVGYRCAMPADPANFIIVPLALLLGGIASAYIELANPGAAPAHGQTNPYCFGREVGQ